MSRSVPELVWRKSKASGQGENCVEVACLDAGGWVLRDSKYPSGPLMRVSSGAWRAFVAGVKAGEVG
ncbi:DUF397 domain-containing protein [Sphaerisporangium sp. NPDC051011]|uniref:DUF397 domain-containing protein n=1 Tax=Sphaerisporangium sp. NPDC051011 TaxID=3155792 RepID=UPI00340B14CB